MGTATHADIALAAARMLKFFRDGGIKECSHLDNYMFHFVVYPGRPGQLLNISFGQSQGHSLAYVIDYLIDNTGVVLEARLNPMLGFTKVVVKADHLLPGYEAFGQDIFGNNIQDKRLETARLYGLERELTSLSEL